MSDDRAGLVPKRSYRVRRRKVGDACLLVSGNRPYEIDELTDAIWVACDGRRTVTDVADHVRTTRDLDAAKAASVTTSALSLLEKLGLLQLVAVEDRGRC